MCREYECRTFLINCFCYILYGMKSADLFPLKGIIQYWFQSRSYVPCLRDVLVIFLFLSLCVWLSREAIFQWFFTCDTWLNVHLQPGGEALKKFNLRLFEQVFKNTASNILKLLRSKVASLTICHDNNG